VVSQHEISGIVSACALGVDLQETDFDSPFRDLGIDSLSLFEVFDQIESVTGLTFKAEDLPFLDSVTSIVTFVNARLGESS
jgi:acyl carrier protein